MWQRKKDGKKPSISCVYDGVRQMMKLNQKYIEKIFYNYGKIKQAVYEARNDPGTVKTGGNGSGHAFVSDPTSIAALKHAMELRKVAIDMGKNQDSLVISNPEKWLKVVGYTYDYFKGKTTANVLRARFSGESYGETCNRLNISRNIYYCYLQEGMHYAQLCAVGLQLMAPF
jgi:hypothetical protein